MPRRGGRVRLKVRILADHEPHACMASPKHKKWRVERERVERGLEAVIGTVVERKQTRTNCGRRTPAQFFSWASISLPFDPDQVSQAILDLPLSHSIRFHPAWRAKDISKIY
jgi:hypothetical protein